MHVMPPLDLYPNKATCHYQFPACCLQQHKTPSVVCLCGIQFRTFTQEKLHTPIATGTTVLEFLWCYRQQIRVGWPVADSIERHFEVGWPVAHSDYWHFPPRLLNKPACLELVNRSCSDMLRDRWSGFRVPIVARVFLTSKILHTCCGTH